MVTPIRVFAFLLGAPLLVLGLIRLVRASAAQLSARERGDGWRHEAGSVTLRRVWPLAAGAMLVEWATNPFTDGRIFAAIGLCAAAYAVAVTSVLRWRGRLRGDWRGVAAQSWLAGVVYGVAIASVTVSHGVRYAAIFLGPFILLVLALRVARRGPSAS